MCVSKCRQLAANNAVKLIRFFDWLLLSGENMRDPYGCLHSQSKQFILRVNTKCVAFFVSDRTFYTSVCACVRACVHACPSYFNTLACLTRENS